MDKVFGNMLSQFKEYFKTLTPIKRASILASVAIAFVAIAVAGLMVSKTNYAVLLRDVPSEQLPLVVQKLKQNNVPFKLDGDGAEILVPSNLLHSAQMVIMSQLGSNSIGTIGLEIFDKQDFGVTSYAQRVNYQRALQGELIRAINSLSAVKRTKVILALPSKKTFLEEGGQSSASVVIEMHPGKIMSAEQVRGIRHLVSSAVEGLEAEKVTIVNSRGKVLSRKREVGASASSELFDVQRKVEANLEERIESILTKAVGAGKVIAKINVKLNQKQIRSVVETVDPDQTAILSQVTETENLNGNRRNPAGIPGARANLPGANNQGQVGFSQNVDKELKTTNYQVPKTVKNIIETAGSVERVTVAVLVDGKMIRQTAENGKEMTEYQPRSAEELKKYEDIVKNVIGFNAQRGDTIKIENLQFQKEDFTDAERLLSNLDRKKFIQALFKWTLLGFSLTLFFFIVVRPFMRWITDSFQDSVEDMLPRTIEELEELQSIDNTLPGMSTALPVLEESLDPDKAESELLKERIMNLVTSDEEKANSAFSLWLVRKDP